MPAHSLCSVQARRQRYGSSSRRDEKRRNAGTAPHGGEDEVKRHPVTEPDLSLMLWYAYMGIGRNDDVIAVLEKLYDEHTNALIAIKVDPSFDPLRSAPRFKELLTRARFAP